MGLTQYGAFSRAWVAMLQVTGTSFFLKRLRRRGMPSRPPYSYWLSFMSLRPGPVPPGGKSKCAISWQASPLSGLSSEPTQ